jgi:hypothetical protein
VYDAAFVGTIDGLASTITVRVLVAVFPQALVATAEVTPYPGAEKLGCEGFGFL